MLAILDAVTVPVDEGPEGLKDLKDLEKVQFSCCAKAIPSDLSPGSTGQEESSALAVLITTKLGGIHILVPGLTLAW